MSHHLQWSRGGSSERGRDLKRRAETVQLVVQFVRVSTEASGVEQLGAVGKGCRNGWTRERCFLVTC